MYREIYLAKKRAVENELNSMESRTQGLRDNPQPKIVDMTLLQLDKLEDKVNDLWAARMTMIESISSSQLDGSPLYTHLYVPQEGQPGF